MTLSALIVPCLLAGLSAYALSRRVDVYSALTDGAADGLRLAGRILPSLVALLTAVSMFRASGAMDERKSGCIKRSSYMW